MATLYGIFCPNCGNELQANVKIRKVEIYSDTAEITIENTDYDNAKVKVSHKCPEAKDNS